LDKTFEVLLQIVCDGVDVFICGFKQGIVISTLLIACVCSFVERGMGRC